MGRTPDVVADVDLAARQREAAAWTSGFAERGYGPRGGAKLVDAEPPVWHESPASALREVGEPGPFLQPYVDLVRSVGRFAGDQATGACMLAGRLVMRALDGVGPVQAYIHGYSTAARQVRVLLDALAEADPEGRCLDTIAPPGWAATVRGGVLGLPPPADLDRIDVRAEAGCVAPEWGPGVHVPGGHRHRDGPVRVLWVARGPGTPDHPLEVRVRDSAQQAKWYAADDRGVGDWTQQVVRIGTGLVVSGRDLGEAAAALEARGVLVWQGAPRSGLERLAQATGCRSVPAPGQVQAEDLGRGRLRRRRRGGWWVEGDGPAWTLLVPPWPRADVAKDTGERLLRASGWWAMDRRALPGGGAWQQQAAAGLRRGADAMPGHAPLAWHAAAQALEHVAACIQGPSRTPVWDVAPAVLLATDAAFATAERVLRVDGLWRRRPSTTTRLRGSRARPGSPRGMPGDIPPLM